MRMTMENAAGLPARWGWHRAGRYGLSVVVLLFPLLAASGCKDRAAQQEVADARAKVQTIKLNLERAAKEIADLKAERDAIRQERDELQQKMTQLVQERDQASSLAQQSQAAIKDLTSRASGQRNTTTTLEKQMAQLKAQIEEQQKTIEQLKTAQAQPTTVEPPAEGTTEPKPAEPNEGQ